ETSTVMKDKVDGATVSKVSVIKDRLEKLSLKDQATPETRIEMIEKPKTFVKGIVEKEDKVPFLKDKSPIFEVKDKIEEVIISKVTVVKESVEQLETVSTTKDKSSTHIESVEETKYPVEETDEGEKVSSPTLKSPTKAV